MSLRHSTENLSASVCTICREDLSRSSSIEVVKTNCNHQFHRACLLKWLRRHNTCPQCRSHCNGRDFLTPNTGVRTRSAALNSPRNLVNLVPPPVIQTSADVPFQENPMNTANSSSNNDETMSNERVSSEQTSNNREGNTSQSNEDSRIRNMVSAVITARQASIFQDLDSRISHIVEHALNNAVSNLNLGASTPTRDVPPNMNDPRASEYDWPQEASNFNNNPQNIPLNDNVVSNNFYKIANLINSWDIKFDGSPRLSVENFIYRIESLVYDTLNGNFQLLCEHAQCLFNKEAKDWYWQYRRSVNRVSWRNLCDALRTNFEHHRSDIDIKEDMRARKQNTTESFDEYKNAVLRIAENLSSPMREQEVVDTLLRGLRPRIRQQLLYVNINSLAELRRLCIKGENLLREIAKTEPSNRNNFPRRINEISEDIPPSSENSIVSNEVYSEVNEVSRKLICWNCRKDGHRYFDCVEKRTIFCYGCGSVGTYKPNCVKCNSENSKTSGGVKNPLR